MHTGADHYAPRALSRLKKIPDLLTHTAGDVLLDRLNPNRLKFQLPVLLEGGLDLLPDSQNATTDGGAAVLFLGFLL